MQYPLNILKEQFEKIPENLQEAILTIDSNEELQEIVEDYDLHIDKSKELMNEISLIMLGLKKSKNFNGNIKKQLNISQERANEITKEVDKEIFVPIRESLRQVQSSSEGVKGEPSLSEPAKSDESAKSDEEVNKEKEEILNEIENPNPSEMEFKKNKEELEDKAVKGKEEAGETTALLPKKIIKKTQQILPNHLIDSGLQAERSSQVRTEAQKESERASQASSEQQDFSTSSAEESSQDSSKQDILEKNLEEEFKQNSYKGNDPYREPID